MHSKLNFFSIWELRIFIKFKEKHNLLHNKSKLFNLNVEWDVFFYAWISSKIRIFLLVEQMHWFNSILGFLFEYVWISWDKLILFQRQKNSIMNKILIIFTKYPENIFSVRKMGKLKQIFIQLGNKNKSSKFISQAVFYYGSL